MVLADVPSAAARVLRSAVGLPQRRPDGHLTDEQLDQIIESHQGRQIIDMLRYTAVGTGEQVRDYLDGFTRTAQADELMISLQGLSEAETNRGMEILAEAWEL